MTMKYKAVLACGGFGTRLKIVSGEIPKPLYPILGKNTIERSIEQLSNYGINNILITLGYQSENFIKFFNQIRAKYKIDIDVFVEEKPLGECGAIWNFKNKLADDFIFINGDIIYSIDFDKLIYFHKRCKSLLTLVTHLSDHPEDSDLVSSPDGALISEIFYKNEISKSKQKAYLGNAGIFVIRNEVLNLFKEPIKKESRTVFNFLVKNLFNMKKNIYSYNTTEYIKDMGTPKRLKIIQKDLKDNNVYPKNYKFKQKVLFLDRDNTLIKCDIGKYILQEKDILFLEDNIMKISLLAKRFDFVCMVTNQPSIAMGNISIEKLDNLHSKIILHCLEKKLKIDVITFCPHHPHKGFEGEIPILKKDCFCRKPNPGLFLEQAFLRNIDLLNSLMIGDSDNDLIAAKNAGCDFKNVNDL